MKYEEIKVGESYKTESGYTEKVLFKHDETRQVVTVDETGEIYPFLENELEHFQPIKKELPKTGLFALGSNTIVYRTEKECGFGFNSLGKYEKKDYWSFISNPECWRTATPEEEDKFIKLLKAEAEKRGLGVDAKIKGHADNCAAYQICVNDGKWDAMFDLGMAFNKNGCIFYNGIWAEPLTMLDEVCDVITKHLPNIVVEMIDGVVILKQL